MLRTWKKLVGCKTILAVALTATPALAQTSDGPTVDQRIKAIEKSVDELKKELTELKSTVSNQKTVDALKNELAEVKSTVSNLKATAETAKPLPADSLKEIAQLKQDIQDLREKLRAGTRVSGFMAQPEASAAAPAAQIELINTYNQEQTIVINGVSYRLLPGARLLETIPVGTFTYEVLGVTAQRARTIAKNGVYTIRVQPPF
jgi:vacuolar-type H+-ATPase subunit I/STV1